MDHDPGRTHEFQPLLGRGSLGPPAARLQFAFGPKLTFDAFEAFDEVQPVFVPRLERGFGQHRDAPRPHSCRLHRLPDPRGVPHPDPGRLAGQVQMVSRSRRRAPILAP